MPVECRDVPTPEFRARRPMPTKRVTRSASRTACDASEAAPLPLTAPDFLDALLDDSAGAWRLSCRLSTASKACCLAIRERRASQRSLNVQLSLGVLTMAMSPGLAVSAVRVICRDCPDLRELVLTGGPAPPHNVPSVLVDELVSMLVQAYPKLRRLHLEDSPCSGSSLELIQTLPELESLALGRLVGPVPLEAVGLAGRWPELRSLRFEGIETSWWRSFLEASHRLLGEMGLDCPKLETFESDALGDDVYELTDRDLPYLFVRPPPLRRLRLGDRCKFSGPAFTKFLQGFPDLQELFVPSDGVTSCIGNDGLAALTFCPKLEVLDVQFCEINDEGMARLSSLRCPLKFLFLAGTEVTSRGIRHIADSHLADSLEHMNLSYCEELEADEAVDLLLEKCKKILSLDVAGTNVSSHTAEKACKELKRRNPILGTATHEPLSLSQAKAADERTVYMRLLGILVPDEWPASGAACVLDNEEP